MPRAVRRTAEPSGTSHPPKHARQPVSAAHMYRLARAAPWASGASRAHQSERTASTPSTTAAVILPFGAAGPPPEGPVSAPGARGGIAHRRRTAPSTISRAYDM